MLAKHNCLDPTFTDKLARCDKFLSGELVCDFEFLQFSKNFEEKEVKVFPTNQNEMFQVIQFIATNGCLQTLDYVESQYTYNPKLFLDFMPNVRFLNLSHNIIRTIETNFLKDFLHLRVLDLSFNRIETIELGTFPYDSSIAFISLQGNLIQKFDHHNTFRFFPASLRYLDLRSNNFVRKHDKHNILQSNFGKLNVFRASNTDSRNMYETFFQPAMVNLELLDLSDVNMGSLVKITSLIKLNISNFKNENLNFLNNIQLSRLSFSSKQRSFKLDNNDIKNLETHLTTGGLQIKDYQCECPNYNTRYNCQKYHSERHSSNNWAYYMKTCRGLTPTLSPANAIIENRKYIYNPYFEMGMCKINNFTEELDCSFSGFTSINVNELYALQNMLHRRHTDRLLPSEKHIHDNPSISYAGNELTSLNEPFPIPCESLDFSMNKIELLNGSLFFKHLSTSLKELNLKYNKLKNLVILTVLPNLRHLDVSHNQLSFIGNFNLAVKNVERLFINDNQIKFIAAEEMAVFKRLKVLDISRNYLLTNLPDQIFNFNLDLRYLGMNNLTFSNGIYPSMAHLSALKRIDFANSNVKNFNHLHANSDKSLLTGLEINLSDNNHFEQLSDTDKHFLMKQSNVWFQSSRVKAYCDSKKTYKYLADFVSWRYFKDTCLIQAFCSSPDNRDKSIVKCDSLIRPDYDNFNLASALYQYTSIKNDIKVLTLNNNNIRNNFAFHSLVELAGGKFTKLELRNNELTELNFDKFHPFGSLETLNLQNNKIRKIKPLQPLENSDISLLKLDLSQNELFGLSNSPFERLGNLNHLDLSRNHLKEISANVFMNLLSLTYLDLSYNYLLSIADNSLTHNTNLITFKMTKCYSKNVPMLSAHKDLKHLALGYNSFVDLQLSPLEKLESITLSYNQEMKLLPEHVHYNTLKHVPYKKIQMKGNSALCNCKLYGTYPCSVYRTNWKSYLATCNKTEETVDLSKKLSRQVLDDRVSKQLTYINNLIQAGEDDIEEGGILIEGDDNARYEKQEEVHFVPAETPPTTEASVPTTKRTTKATTTSTSPAPPPPPPPPPFVPMKSNITKKQYDELLESNKILRHFLLKTKEELSEKTNEISYLNFTVNTLEKQLESKHNSAVSLYNKTKTLQKLLETKDAQIGIVSKRLKDSESRENNLKNEHKEAEDRLSENFNREFVRKTEAFNALEQKHGVTEAERNQYKLDIDNLKYQHDINKYNLTQKHNNERESLQADLQNVTKQLKDANEAREKLIEANEKYVIELNKTHAEKEELFNKTMEKEKLIKLYEIDKNFTTQVKTAVKTARKDSQNKIANETAEIRNNNNGKPKIDIDKLINATITNIWKEGNYTLNITLTRLETEKNNEIKKVNEKYESQKQELKTLKETNAKEIKELNETIEKQRKEYDETQSVIDKLKAEIERLKIVPVILKPNATTTTMQPSTIKMYEFNPNDLKLDTLRKPSSNKKAWRIFAIATVFAAFITWLIYITYQKFNRYKIHFILRNFRKTVRNVLIFYRRRSDDPPPRPPQEPIPRNKKYFYLC